MNLKFDAIVVRKLPNNVFSRQIEEKHVSDLPDNTLLINVKYSSLNYKDALSSIGNMGVTRRFPHTPGIDAAGIVVKSNSNEFKVGDNVVVFSQDLGINTPGGFGEYISVPDTWPIHLPKNMTLKESMIFGTAGYTAALAVESLLANLAINKDNKILVTGVSGGVGSLSASILSKLGYLVIGSTGKALDKDFIDDLGIFEIINRDSLNKSIQKPLLKTEFDGAIDTVGGETLSNIIKSLKENGVAVATGMVSSENINTSIMPFILRGIKLIGVNSQITNKEKRIDIWERLSNEWRPFNLDKIARFCTLNEINQEIDKILKGEIKGRVVLDLENK
jgi:acrylyl-CoA reductase (NADPH)